ncbi:MAG: type II secretion system F family protein [Candidatus Methanomethyliaceae archaeon]|nr:type II secretion system F family protein [Candidatus Methanomethyliaceae archaeon]
MVKVKLTFPLWGISYAYFAWFGRLANRLWPFKGISSQLDAANIRIHPETYLSMCGFVLFPSLIVSVILAVVGYFLISPLMLFLLAIPPIVLLIFLLYPRTVAMNRASNLDTEIPFAAAYISVLASGGISPFKAFERLKDIQILPQMGNAAKLVYTDTKARGIDPVTSLENNAKHVPSKDYKEFILGYASTLRVGGDTQHYLQKKTETMFENRKNKVKVIGERIALLMESYIMVAILLALTLYIMYVVTKILPMGGQLFSMESFVLFSYIFLPVISGVFIYLIDLTAPKYPISDYRAYKWIFATLPVAIFLFIPMVLAFFINILMVAFLPAAIADLRYSRQTGTTTSGITNFLRDLVEIRKTGISPEKCMQYLSKREYGKFTTILRSISNQIGWGLSFRRVLANIKKELHGWLNPMYLFLLIDSIDVGGGTPETLEGLATFGESISTIEKEKRANLRPLIFLPYIGGVVMLLSTLTILFFARSIFQMFSASFGFGDFVRVFIPPIVFNIALMGLVAGKCSGERVSAGFIHAFILTVITLISMWLAPIFMGSFQVVFT